MEHEVLGILYCKMDENEDFFLLNLHFLINFKSWNFIPFHVISQRLV